MKKIFKISVFVLVTSLITNCGMSTRKFYSTNEETVLECTLDTSIAGDLGVFEATYDVDKEMLTIYAQQFYASSNTATLRVIAAVEGTQQVLVLESGISLNAGGIIRIELGANDVAHYDTLGIEVADGTVGMGSKYAIGYMPANDCREVSADESDDLYYR